MKVGMKKNNNGVFDRELAPVRSFGTLWRRVGCADVVNFNAHCVKIECETLTS